ncbi:MAG: hypothetical protein KJP21_08685, partial [Bacteroidia bacterium]|nr:hypothetical protein [Bacteroidia bacterium]
MYFDASGNYTLANSIQSNESIHLRSGSLTTNNQNIHAMNLRFLGNDSLKLYLGTSTVTLDWNIGIIDSSALFSEHTALLFDGDEATFNLNGSGAFTSVFSYQSLDIQKIYLHQNVGLFEVNNGTIDSIICLSTSAYANLGQASSSYVYGAGDINFLQNSTIGVCVVDDDLSTASSISFDTLRLKALDGYSEYVFNSGSTVTLNDDLVFPSGSCTQTYRIESSLFNSAATLSQPSGSVIANFATINSITTTGGAAFTANNVISQDGNNTGWTLNSLSGTNYYWVGNSGDWADPTQWALSSGGTAQASTGCIPTGADNVYFDGNSFAAGANVVTLDQTANCFTMDWTNAGFSPHLQGSNSIYIYGNLEAISTLSWEISQPTEFVGTGTHTLDFADLTASSDIRFSNKGTFNIESNMSTNADLHIDYGTVNTNDYTLHTRRLLSLGNATSTLNLGNSLIEVDWYNNIYNLYSVLLTNAALTINGSNSTIYAMGTGSRNNVWCTSSQSLGDIYMDNAAFCTISESSADTIKFNDNTLGYLNGTGTINSVIANSSTFYVQARSKVKKMEINNSARITSSVVVDTFLLLNNAATVNLDIYAGDTLIINDSALINANGCFNHNIRSYTSGSAAYISMPSGSSINTDFISVRDISGIGGGTFNAGGNSADLGGNTGWTFIGPTYNLNLKYDTYCIIAGQTKEIKAAPDGNPANYWWKQTSSPFDTFNTGIDTVMASGPLNFAFISEYGPGCTFSDTISVVYTNSANGVSQTFYNYAEDKDWFNCSNWESNLIPDSISNVLINTGDTIHLEAGDTAYCKDITINGIFVQTGGILYVYGGIINNGVMDITGGQWVLEGETAKSTNGSQVIEIDTLIIQRNAITTLGQSINVSGYAEFIDGIINSSATYPLHFTDGS